MRILQLITYGIVGGIILAVYVLIPWVAAFSLTVLGFAAFVHAILPPQLPERRKFRNYGKGSW